MNGGGNATMGTKITGINAVQLAGTTAFTANTTAGLKISGSSSGGDTITLAAPTQSVIAGGLNETVRATAANAGASVSGLGANSTLQITSEAPSRLTPGPTSHGEAERCEDADAERDAVHHGDRERRYDTIQAGASYQTLTGGAGTDTLIGFSGGSDMFRDTAANLNGDAISGFVASDKINFTNLVFAAATVTAAVSGANTKVMVASGPTKSTFTMAGTWSSLGFSLHPTVGGAHC